MNPFAQAFSAFSGLIFNTKSPENYIFVVSIHGNDKDKLIFSLDRQIASIKSFREKIKDRWPELTEYSICYDEPGIGLLEIGDDTILVLKMKSSGNVGRMPEFTLKLSTLVTPVNSIISEVPISERKLVPAQVEVIDDTPKESYQVMLSYAWSDKDKVLKIKNELDGRGLSIWMDVTDMKKNIYESMAKGVLQSKVIVPCLSLNYADRPNCKREINFAADNNKPMVPIRLESFPINSNNYNLESVKLITSGELYIDLSQQDWENPDALSKSMDNLKRSIDRHLELFSTSAIPAIPPPPSSASGSVPAVDRVKMWLNPVDMQDECNRLENDYVDGTRLWLVNDVVNWIKSPNSRVLWVSGGAGIGKSMMSHVIALKIPQDWLGCIFYCRHNDVNKNNAANILKTISYNLSLKNPPYHDYLRGLLENDEKLKTEGKRSILDSSIPILHKTLFMDGLQFIDSSHPTVIVIDALDECGVPGQVQREDLLSIFKAARFDLPSFVKFVVTARPEPDIWESLYDLNAEILEPTNELNMKDLRIFITSRLDRMRLFTPGEVTVAVDQLAKKSEGVFVYARLACDSIATECPKDAPELMKLIGDLHTGMDSIYNELFKACDSPDVRLVMATICEVQKPLSISGIAKLLGISEARVGGVYIALRSILKQGKDGEITVIHKSLKDFVMTPRRSTSVDFTAVKVAAKLSECCLGVLQSELKFNMANFEEKYYYTLHANIPNFKDKVEAIPEHVRYSVVFAASHLSSLLELKFGSDFIVGLHEKISLVLKLQLTYWIETLALLDRLSDLIPISASLIKFYNQSTLSNIPEKNTIVSLISDTLRILEQFAIPLSECAFQVYWTVIPFTPIRSTFHTLFTKNRPNGKYPRLIQANGIATEWSPCLSTLEGHSVTVKAVAISPDGDRIVSGSDDQMVKIWDSKTGKEIRTLQGHTDFVNAVVVTMDGSRIISGSYDKTLAMWDLETGGLIRTLTGHTHSVNSVAVFNEGTRIVSGSTDKTVKIWDLNSGVVLSTLVGHTDAVNSVVVSDDGKLVVSGSRDQTVKLWDSESGRELKTLRGHTDAVLSVAISKLYVVSGSRDHLIKVWDVKTGQEVRTLSGHTSWVNSVTVSNYGSLIVSGSADRTVKVWGLNTGILIRSLTGHAVSVKSVAISSGGIKVVSAAGDKTIKIWDLNSVDEGRQFTGHKDIVSMVEMTDDGEIIKTTDYGDDIMYWSMETGELLQAKPDVEFSKARKEYQLLKAGWVSRSDAMFFWVPAQLRSLVFCSSKSRMVTFTEVVDGYALPVFIDVSELVL
ncbi:POC1 centriolar protein A [Nowakowskiella sp. JEL0407]|nr:POC1 centriolar protein A [Nowakowskiella sp. JEL0407]